MKTSRNLFIILILSLLSIASCTKKANITISNADAIASSVAATPTGGEFTLNFNSTSSWNIVVKPSSASSWVNVSPNSGEAGNISAKIITQKNPNKTGRTASIFINSGEINKGLSITQEGGSLTILNSNKVAGSEVESCLGGNFNLEFKTSIDWVASISPEAATSWLSLDKTEGEGGENTIVISSKANISSKERKGKVTITSSGVSSEVEITQGNSYLKLNSSVVEISSEGGEFTVDVESNVDYSVATPEWIKAVEGKKATFSADVNNENFRIGEITFSYEGLKDVTVAVQQNCKRKEGQTYRASFLGNTLDLPMYSDIEVTEIVSKPDWLTVVDTKNLIFSVEENTSDERKGTIEFKIKNASKTKQLTIIQDKYDPSPEWLNRTFYRQSLVVRFTATWCGYCPNMAAAIKEAKKGYPDRIVNYSLYGSSAASVDFKQTSTVASYYNISGYPTAIQDGKIVQQNESSSKVVADNIMLAATESVKSYPSMSNIKVNTAYDLENIEANIAINIKETGDYKLFALVTEDGIVESQTGAGGNYVHDGVTKEYLTDLMGDKLTISKEGTYYFNYIIDTPKSVQNVNNCNIVVYLMKTGEKSSTETGLDIIQKNEYVDNVTSTKLGTNTDFRYEE